MTMQKVQEKTNTLEMYTKVFLWCYKFLVNNTDHVLILSSHLVLPTTSDHSFLTTADGQFPQMIKSQESFDIYFFSCEAGPYFCILHWHSCMINVFILQVSEKLTKHLSKISAVLEKVWIASSFPSCKIFFPLADCTLESN